MAPTWSRCPRPARRLAGQVAGRSRPDRHRDPHAGQLPGRPEENAFREILGGDQKKQIEAVRRTCSPWPGGTAGGRQIAGRPE